MCEHLLIQKQIFIETFSEITLKKATPSKTAIGREMLHEKIWRCLRIQPMQKVNSVT